MHWKKWKFFKSFFYFLVVFISFLGFSGCGGMSNFREVSFEQYEKTQFYKLYKKEKLLKKPVVGEKLVYKIYWTGIPAGKVILHVKEVTEYNNSKVYYIVARVVSNKIFSFIYKTDDTFHSYVDQEGLFSRKYKMVRRGEKKKNEEVTFDYNTMEAEINSGNENKKIQIPCRLQDALSSLYYFRSQNIKLGDKIIMDTNVDEKNWKLECNVKKFGNLSLINLGKFNSFLVKTKIKRNGEYRKDRRLEIWFSADEKRIPLLINIDVPLGYMRVVLCDIN